VDPVPQLIAEAIAAVKSYNRTRDLLSFGPLEVKVMAGIAMTGTSPTFFKIPVTLELIDAFHRGGYPATPMSLVVPMNKPVMPLPLV
jgi:hypothetical protein